MAEAKIPPRIDDCEVRVISFEPLIGIMTIEISDGPIELAINKSGAALMGLAVMDFMGAEPATEAETAKMD